MVTYLGSSAQLCFGEGGALQTNITGVWGEWLQCMDHTGFAPAHSGVSFLDLHCSGSRLLCRGTVQSRLCISCTSQVQVLRYSTKADSVGRAFCALPRPKQLRRPGAWRVHCPRWTVSLNHLPSPSHSVSWVCRESTISGVLCITSGELISGYNPPKALKYLTLVTALKGMHSFQFSRSNYICCLVVKSCPTLLPSHGL